VFNRLGREMVVRFVLIGYFFLPPLVITLAKRILRQYLMYIGFFMIKGERLFHINPLNDILRWKSKYWFRSGTKIAAVLNRVMGYHPL
jgi:hypothetical protein